MEKVDLYEVERILIKKSVGFKDLLTLEEYGIEYESIEGYMVIVYYKGNEYVLRLKWGDSMDIIKILNMGAIKRGKGKLRETFIRKNRIGTYEVIGVDRHGERVLTTSRNYKLAKHFAKWALENSHK